MTTVPQPASPPDAMTSPTPPARDQRIAELQAQHAHVSAHPLDGLLVLIATNTAGDLEHAEVLDRAGHRLPPDEAARRLANTHKLAQRVCDAATDGLVALIALQSAQGDDVNVSALARDANLARQTLYNRLATITVAPEHGA